MPELDWLIRGGTVVDGLRTPRFVADVGIADGRIAEIGRIPRSARMDFRIRCTETPASISRFAALSATRSSKV